MCKNLCFLVFLLLVLVMSGNLCAQDATWLGLEADSNGNYLWTNPNNWDVPNDDGYWQFVLPSGTNVRDGAWCLGPNSPTVDYDYNPPYDYNGLKAMCSRFAWADLNDCNATFTMKRGDFEIAFYHRFAEDGGSGIFNMEGGTHRIATRPGSVGYNELQVGGDANGSALLNMTGGLIEIGLTTSVPALFQIEEGGHVQLDGGTIYTVDFEMEDDPDPCTGEWWATMDVNGGTLKVVGDDRGVFAPCIADGRITGGGQERSLSLIYDGTDTILTYQAFGEGKAYDPTPGISETDVERDIVLSWKPGDYVETHEVYLGTVEQDVIDADTGDATGIYRSDHVAASNSYDPPELLIPGMTYYWRVDEANSISGTIPGDIWQFTIKEYLTIEDFQSYDANDASASVRAVWRDYYTGTKNTGSQIFVTDGEPNRGGQSLGYDYFNDYPDTDNYSEIEATVASLPSDVGTDWTIGGVKSLVLYYFGQGSNEDDQMYVALKDTSGNISQRTIGSPLMNAEVWLQWNIDLQYFEDNGNVDLENVSMIYLGIGDSNNANLEDTGEPGGTGTMYFDDLQLWPPRCVTGDQYGQSRADLTGDCKVNEDDIEVLAASWLAGATLNPVAPNDANLIAKYTFDDYTATDVTGNGNDGTFAPVDNTPAKVIDDPLKGRVVQCVPAGLPGGPKVGLVGQYVDCGGGFLESAFDINEYITVALWFKNDFWTTNYQAVAQKGYSYGIQSGYYSESSKHNVEGSFQITDWEGLGAVELGLPQSRTNSWTFDKWHHIATTWDHSVPHPTETWQGVVRFYYDGQVVPDDEDGDNWNKWWNTSSMPPLPKRAPTQFMIGGQAEAFGYRSTNGFLDDVHVYSRTLTANEIAYLARPVIDLNGDGKIDFKDFAIIGSEWQTESTWP